MAVVTQQGRDITQWLEEESARAGISVRLATAAIYAESKFNELAERYGTRTSEGIAARLAGPGQLWRFQNVIDTTWPDISFGLCQRIIAYHWAGDDSKTAANVLAVRDAVLNDPERDIREMCAWLADDYRRAGAADLTPIGGDRELGACIIYNAGHWPGPTDTYWVTHGANVQNYRNAFVKADALLLDVANAPVAPAEGVSLVTIEEKAQWMTENGDRLGNGGVPYSPVCEWETSAGTMRFQQYWLGSLLEYPVDPTEANPSGRDVTTAPEGTLSDEQLRQFRG